MNFAERHGPWAVIAGASEGTGSSFADQLAARGGRTNTPMFRAFMEKRGLPVGAGAAEPDDVAKLGLERLPHGPVQNWGAGDDQQGLAPMSAAARRGRILKIEAASNNLFKAK